MKVPYNWLLAYVDIDKTIQEVGDALTLSGSKVEEVIDPFKEIDKVVTGKVLSIEKHPQADKLVVCQMNVGEETIQIVTGATNLTVGAIVPVALHGSSLPGGVKIKKGKLRGVESNGMMCSEVELGVADDASGIMILPPDTPVGVDIKKVVKGSGGVIDFEITSNRSDCYGVYGIAREAAVTFRKPLKPLKLDYKEGSDNINDYLSVQVKDELCKRYTARVIKNVKIAPSPEWMQSRLNEAGVRPINNIVDITNYIMLELGQPLHAFDYRNLEKKEIIVRKADDNEKFVTLDGVERTLDSTMLVIADGERPVAIAGIMGGENSEIKDDTTTVVMEFANFDGVNIRRTSKKLNLRTDASGKFEKDLDPNLVDTAMARALSLVEELGAGEIVGGRIDVYENKITPWQITVSPEWINGFLGIEVSREDMKEMLESLELKVEDKGDFVLTIPTFRQDLRIREDIAEEIVRLYGYDKIPSVKIHGETVEAVWTKEQVLERAAKNVLAASGLDEIMTYSFVSPKVFDMICLPADSKLRNVVKIKNPLGEDFSIMKTTALPSMMDCLARNYAKDNKKAALFELSRVYRPIGEALPDERDNLCIGIYGEGDFFTLKGIVENLLEEIGVKNAEIVRETEDPSYHPGRCAKILIRKKEAGVFGEIHPQCCENYGMDSVRVYAAEIDLKYIYEIAESDKKYKPLPKFPAVTRDIAMLIDDSISVGEMEDVIKRSGRPLLESVELFDVYKGKQIPDGKKSVAFALSYRAEEKTLKDEEVNKVHDKVVKMLAQKLGAELR